MLHQKTSASLFWVILVCTGLSCSRDDSSGVLKPYYFLKAVHSDPVHFSVDSLVAERNFNEAEEQILKALSLDPKSPLILRAMLLNIKTETDTKDTTLYREIAASNPADSIEMFYKSWALYNYQYHFDPESSEVNTLRSFLKAEFLSDYYKAVIEVNTASLLFLTFSNLRMIGQHLSAGEAYLKSCPKYTMTHAQLFRMLAVYHNAQRQKEASLTYCEKLKSFDNYYFAPDRLFKAAAHILTGRIYRYNTDIDGLRAENFSVEKYIGNDSCSREFHGYIFNRMLAHMGKKDPENQKYFLLLQLIADSLKLKCGQSLANHSLMVGMNYNRTGYPDKALSFLYEALSFEKQAKHPDKTLESITINSIYEILLSQDRFDEALASVMIDAEYEGIFDKTLFVNYIRNHSVYPFHFLINLIDIYYAKYKKNKNIADLKDARELVQLVNDEVYQQYDVTDEDAIIKFFDDEVERYYDLALNVLFELYQNTANNSYLEEFVLLSDRHSNVTLERDMKLKSGGFNLPESIQQMELELMEEVKNYKRYGKSSAIYADAPLRYKAFQANLKKEYPQYFDQALVKNSIDLPDIYENLKKVNGTVIKTDILEDKMFITIIKAHGITVYPVNFNPEHADKLREFSEILSNNLDVSVQEYQDCAFEIYQWIFGSLNLKNLGKKIFFIPSGIFHNLNPEALVTEIRPDVATFSDLQYWIKTAEIVLTPGISFLKNRQTDDLRTLNDLDITAFSFSGEREKKKSFGTMSGLIGTYYEVRDIKNIFPQAKIFVGKNATLDAFRMLSKSTPPDILHLGLHGFSESSVRDDVKLYFRKGDDIDSLAGYELLNLNISAGLLVLSACQSATGKIHAGEGIYSMTRYFMINQVNHIIASAWNLDDQLSAYTFSRFYSNTNPANILNGSALTDVKRTLINKSVHPHFVFGLVRYTLEI